MNVVRGAESAGETSSDSGAETAGAETGAATETSGASLLTAFSVALFYRTYLYPQVYDFFVKGVSLRYGLNMTKFKILSDVRSLAVAVVLTLIFFRRFNGIGVGTLIMTALNGLLIGAFGKLIDRLFVFRPLLPAFAKKFDLTGGKAQTA